MELTWRICCNFGCSELINTCSHCVTTLSNKHVSLSMTLGARALYPGSWFGMVQIFRARCRYWCKEYKSILKYISFCSAQSNSSQVPISKRLQISVHHPKNSHLTQGANAWSVRCSFTLLLVAVPHFSKAGPSYQVHGYNKVRSLDQ